jgi:hypothetical protein
MKHLCALGFLLAAAAAAAQDASLPAAGAVLKLRAIGADASVQLGSGIALGGSRVAVACHVTRDASRIEVVRGNRVLPAGAQVGSVRHDLCVLTVPGLEATRAPQRPSVTLRPGEPVFAAGFPDGGDLVLTAGVVSGLHGMDGAWVIQTTAPFTFGASGGALFDTAGRLVGMLAFKAPSGGSLHFALPADWLDSGSEVARHFAPVPEQGAAVAFWALPRESQPHFLRAAVLEARGDLRGLAEWVDRRLAESRSDAGVWIAAGKAAAGLGDRERALAAFAEAARLDPADPEACHHLAGLGIRP